MRSSLSAIGIEAHFKPQHGLEIDVPFARRVALTALAQPIASYAAYAQLDLPVVIGHLSAAQQRAFTAKLGLPEMRLSTNTTSTLGTDFAAVAASLTQPAAMQSLRPIVSDILQFDRATFSDRLLSVEAYFFRDTPGPQKVVAERWHREKHYGVEQPNWSHYLVPTMPPRRIYTVRSAAPMELIRDQVGLSAAGRALVRNITDRDTTAPAHARWVQAVKEAGLFMQPKPFEVVLMSSEATLHKSHRPDTPTPSVYLQLRLTTVADAPGRPWSPGALLGKVLRRFQRS